jgi:hypothetical protein
VIINILTQIAKLSTAVIDLGTEAAVYHFYQTVQKKNGQSNRIEGCCYLCFDLGRHGVEEAGEEFILL